MNALEAKEEFIRRYIYLYEYALHFYGPACILSDESRDEELRQNFLEKLEDLTLGTDEVVINARKSISEIMNSRWYAKKSLQGMKEIARGNRDEAMVTILRKLYHYVNMQSIDLKNKDRKLQVIDEYIRMASYRNDGLVWTSGYNVTFRNIENYPIYSSSFIPKETPNRENYGVLNNEFINTFSEKRGRIYKGRPHSPAAHFTEKEKQIIYLKYHDEIPCDLEFACRPSSLGFLYQDEKPCGKTFANIDEYKIFIAKNGDDYDFYYFCPNCGKLIDINKELLAPSIQLRIISRCLVNSKVKRGNVLQKI